MLPTLEWENLADSLRAGVGALWNEFESNNKLILTEADLQSHLFSRFQIVLSREQQRLSVHSETSFLDNDLENSGKLRWKPDLVVFDNDEIDVTKGSELYHRKGYAFWGSCIAFELKFNRSVKIQSFWRSWKADIDKLANIRDTHYGANTQQFYDPYFVLFSRLLIPEEVKDQISQYASAKDVPAIALGIEYQNSET